MQKTLNPSEFLQLVEANRGIIYKVCHSYCSNRSDRDDLAQEIVYQLLRSAQRYDATQRFTTWMYRVALNTAISFYRKSRSNTITLTTEADHIADTAAPEDENLTRLQTFIQDLRDLDKALMLLYLEGHSYKEIAGVLGISNSNVATSISRIKEKLKRKFLPQNATDHGRP